MPTVIAQTAMLNEVCTKLGVPRLVTEQYPKALGKTVPELGIDAAEVVAKMKFSMITPDVASILSAKPQINHVILCGIEAHVCVQQTTLDLLAMGYNVHLICDAISSQR